MASANQRGTPYELCLVPISAASFPGPAMDDCLCPPGEPYWSKDCPRHGCMAVQDQCVCAETSMRNCPQHGNGTASLVEQRGRDYGHPLDNHQRIADFWTVRLRDKLKEGASIDPHEAAAMMRLVKESRLMQTPGHPDSLDDIDGYTEVERQIHDEVKRRQAQ